MRAFETEVKTTGEFSQFLQHGFIEPASNSIAVFIANKLLAGREVGVANPASRSTRLVGRFAARTITDRDQFPIGRPGANGENAQAFLGSFLRLGQGIFVVIFAVGKKHKHLMAVLLMTLEGFHGRINRFAEVGAAFGDEVNVDEVDVLTQGFLIDGERALEEGGAGKRDEAEPVAFAELKKFLNGELGTLHARWEEVVGKHTA